ncbi:Dolichyl-diphosphooligosaccharide--protein glycosyltransferase subunit DAD1-like protein, partial [Drosera capensis]
ATANPGDDDGEIVDEQGRAGSVPIPHLRLLSNSQISQGTNAQLVFLSLNPSISSKFRLTNLYSSFLQIIDLYVVFAVFTALIQVLYMAIVGSFPFNSFLSGVLSCTGTAVLAVCLRIQVNKENKEFKDLPPERAFADFVLCNLVLHLVIMNFLG